MPHPHALCLSLLLSCCLTSYPCAAPQPRATLERKPEAIEDSLKDNIHVVETHVGGEQRETIVVKIKSRAYRFPDERVSYVENGHRCFYNDDEDRYGHDLELSPDKRWLFVGRKCMHTVAVGYLYHRLRRGGFVPVHPHGLLFDAAAVDFFAHACGTPRPLMSQGSWLIGFDAWDRDGRGMTFDLTVGEHHPRMVRGSEIVGHYDFGAHKFRLIQRKDFYDRAAS